MKRFGVVMGLIGFAFFFVAEGLRFAGQNLKVIEVPAYMGFGLLCATVLCWLIFLVIFIAAEIREARARLAPNTDVKK